MKKFSIISRFIASFLAVIMFMTPVSSVFAQKAVDNREITVMAERDAKDDAEESGTFLWWCGGFLLTFVIPYVGGLPLALYGYYKGGEPDGVPAARLMDLEKAYGKGNSEAISIYTAAYEKKYTEVARKRHGKAGLIGYGLGLLLAILAFAAIIAILTGASAEDDDFTNEAIDFHLGLMGLEKA